MRDAITIETKTFNPLDTGQDHGLSRVRVCQEIDGSLKRLGIEQVSLYMAHARDHGGRRRADAR